MTNRNDYYVSHNFEKAFPLSTCVLYYLGWYERSNNWWDDLKKCLDMDGYYIGPHTRPADVYRIFIGMLDDWNMYCANRGMKMISATNLLMPKAYLVSAAEDVCGEYGKVEWLATIMALLSEWAFTYNRLEVILTRPVFKKGDKIRYQGYKNGRTYREANRQTEKYPTWADTINLVPRHISVDDIIAKIKTIE